MALCAVLAIILFQQDASGTVTAGSTDKLDQSPAFISASSTPRAVFGFGATSDTNGTDSLVSVNISFTGTGFSTGDLATLSTDSSQSGVGIYRDDGSVGDQFDSTDTPVTTATCTWNGDVVQFTLSAGSEYVLYSIAGSYHWFITIATSSSISDGDTITASISAYNITFSDNTTQPPATVTADTLTADTVAPGSWGGLSPTTWVTISKTPSVSIQVKDDTSGLRNTSASYNFTNDNWVTWSGWLTATVTGADGSTASQTMTASNVAFNLDSATDNKIKFRINDTAGNSGTSTEYTIQIDTATPGSWTGLGPSGWYTASKTPSVSIQVRDDTSGLRSTSASYNFTNDNWVTWSGWTPITVAWTDGTTLLQTITASNVPFNADSATKNKIKFRISDTAGNSGTSTEYTIQIDSAAPGSWTGPSPSGWYTASKTPSVSIQVKDDTSGLRNTSASYNFTNDNWVTWSGWTPITVAWTDGTTLLQTITAVNVPFNADSATKNKIKFRINDTAGNSGTSTEYTIQIDTALPAGWTSFAPTGWSTTQTPTITIQVWDATSGLDNTSAEYQYSRDGGTTWSGWIAASVTGASGTVALQTITATGVPFNQDSATLNQIRFRITDVAGLVNSSLAFNVQVDTTTPGGWTSNTPAGWYNLSTVTATVQAKDNGSGLDVSTAQYQYTKDGGATWSTWLAASATGSDGNTSLQTISASNVAFDQDSATLNRIRFRASDMLGQTGTSGVYIIQIDTAIPQNPSSISCLSHSVRVWSNSSGFTFTWDHGSDGLSGIKGYAILVDNASNSVPQAIWGSPNLNTTNNWVYIDTIADSGSIYIHLRAQDQAGNWASSAIHLGAFYLDRSPPTIPNKYSSASHSGYVWSNDNTIELSWWGDSDDRSGIEGYSYDWDNAAGTIPDSVIETSANSTVSSALSGGKWYLHVRCRDRAGNWNSSVYHIGEFWIDTTQPQNPKPAPTTHTVSTWSSTNVVGVSWNANPGSDDLSMIDGYSFIWDNSPSTIPDSISDGAVTSSSSPSMADGNSIWFHIRAVDGAGNWNAGATHLGPFWIDTTPPQNPQPASSSHVVFTWSNVSTISIFWASGMDAGSGTAGFSYLWDTIPATIPPAISSGGALNTQSPVLSDGNGHWFHLRTVDAAGNWAASAVHLGPFYLDMTPPAPPTSSSSSPPALTWSNDDTVEIWWWGDLDWGAGLDGYSYVWARDGSTMPDYYIDSKSNQFASMALADGAWYFQIRCQDRAGNWNQAVSFGPFWIDTSPPQNPVAEPRSHQVKAWSGNDRIVLDWSAAAGYDILSGISGYSCTLDTSASTLPDEMVETGDESGTFVIPVDGNNYWFHIRAVDKAGNWNLTAFHLGPFWIDTTAPLSPSIYSPSHRTVTWTNHSAVDVAWTGALDMLSGVAGYSFVWDSSPDTVPDGTPETDGTSTTSPALAEGGSHWFHVRAVDRAGNLAAAAHLGPFMIDVTPPFPPAFFDSTPEAGNWTNKNRIDILWWGDSDDLSGVAGYYYLWDRYTGTVPDVLPVSWSNRTVSPPLQNGIWYCHVMVVDNAGNRCILATDFGPFKIDTTPPVNPAGFQRLPARWSSDPDFDFAWVDGTDENGILGYSVVIDQNPGTVPPEAPIIAGKNFSAAGLPEGVPLWIHVRTCDLARNWASAPLTEGPFYISTSPPSGGFWINGGNGHANSLTVLLTFDVSHASGIKECMISDRADFSGGTWEPFSPERKWSFPPAGPDGSRTVFVLVKSNAGTTGSMQSSIIVLTRKPAIDIRSLPSQTDAGSIVVRGRVVDFRAENAVRVWIGNDEVLLDPGGNFSARVGLQTGANKIIVEAVDGAGNRVEERLSVDQARSAVQFVTADVLPWLDFVLLLVLALVAGIALLRMRGVKRPAAATVVEPMQDSGKCPTCGAPKSDGGPCQACNGRFEAENVLVRALHADLEIEDRARFALSISSAIGQFSEGKIQEGRDSLRMVVEELDGLEARSSAGHRKPVQYAEDDIAIMEPILAAPATAIPRPISEPGPLPSDPAFTAPALALEDIPIAIPMPVAPRAGAIPQLPFLAPSLLGPKSGPPLGVLFLGQRENGMERSTLDGLGACGAISERERIDRGTVEAIARELFVRARAGGSPPLMLVVGHGELGDGRPSVLVEDIGNLGATGALADANVVAGSAAIPREDWRSLIESGQIEGVRIIPSEEIGVSAPFAADILGAVDAARMSMRETSFVRVVGIYTNQEPCDPQVLKKLLGMIHLKKDG